MKLTITLERYPAGSSNAGNLKAYVTDADGHRGRNLLVGYHYSGVAGAMQEVRRQLSQEFPGEKLEELRFVAGPPGSDARVIVPLQPPLLAKETGGES